MHLGLKLKSMKKQEDGCLAIPLIRAIAITF